MCKADTIVLTRVTPATSAIHSSLEPEVPAEILEKPGSKADNLRMLLELNGHSCEVVTGVTVGEHTPLRQKLRRRTLTAATVKFTQS